MPITAGSILGGLQSAYGIGQLIKGSKLTKSNTRPTYEIPEEIKGKLNNAQMMALEGLPAAQKQNYINNIQRSSQFALNAMNDRKAGLAGLSSLVQNQNDSYNNLLGQDAAARQNNQRYLGAVQSEMAGYRDKAFDINKQQPFIDQANAAAALKGAGIQNIAGGLKTGESAFAQNDYAKALAGNSGIGNIPSSNIGSGMNTQSSSVYGKSNPLGLNNVKGLSQLSETQKLVQNYGFGKNQKSVEQSTIDDFNEQLKNPYLPKDQREFILGMLKDLGQ